MNKTLAAILALSLAVIGAVSLPAVSGPAPETVRIAAATVPQAVAPPSARVEAKATMPATDPYGIRAEDALVSAVRFDPPADACAF